MSVITTETKNKILSAREERLSSEFEQDPIVALGNRLLKGIMVTEEQGMFVLDQHQNGPWVINEHWKLNLYKELCEEINIPLEFNKGILFNEIMIYMEFNGDCCIIESSKGKTFAVWTRKGRVQIGFKNESDAEKFRKFRIEYDMQHTKNKYVKLVVLEDYDNLLQLYQVTEDLNKM